ncbi:MAG TPA: TRC40/GET3/ArsA family transport-energizing ATPase [Thermodesulfobacteriota bacterium]|nr:TRC40/GET3/ArsA family transport-energizing ATPase [Thermodesulfobacteriota bacterium]
MRIILFTGKGGVGKTSIAAATALRCADMGYKTKVYSTDAAHSLADSFNKEIGSADTVIKKNLFAQEIDVNEEIRRNWGPIQGFIQQFLKYRGMENLIAEEMAVFPGMEEVFSLLELKDRVAREDFDVVIIDCAPTGDTLRLLACPDIAKWYMEKIFNIERKVFKAVRPVVRRFVDMPLPTDDVFDSMEGLYKNLIGIKEVLTDREISSIRIVLNPEKMVIKESQRAYTFLNLFGYSVDAVIANRILPEEIKDPYYRKWKEIQAKHMKEVEASFSPLPIFLSKFWDQEVIGMKQLSRMAEDIYGDKDPTSVFFKEKPMEITGSDGCYDLYLKLPFATKEDLDIWVHGDELTIKFLNFKRNILLPRALSSLKLRKAEFIGNTLKVNFGGDDHGRKV